MVLLRIFRKNDFTICENEYVELKGKKFDDSKANSNKIGQYVSAQVIKQIY